MTGQSGKTGMALVVAAASMLCLGVPAKAETNQVRIAQQYGLSYLPLMVMQQQKLVEKHAKQAGLGEVTVSWRTLANSTAMMDAALSGQIDIISAGAPTLLTVWGKTVGTAQELRGLAGIQHQPHVLISTNPDIKTIRDYKPTDRIALPAVQLSGHAIVLQMAAAKIWGEKEYGRLDANTVSMPHPEATTALISGRSEITSHFTNDPYAYYELREAKNAHLVLNSYDVLGRHTNGIMMTSARFYSANPKTAKAVLDALEEADAFIKANPEEAAKVYIAMTKDTQGSVEDFTKMIKNPDLDFNPVPKAIMEWANFMHKNRRIPKLPESWKDLFFPLVHDRDGS